MNHKKGFLYAFTAAATWAVTIILSRVILKNGLSVYTVSFWTTVLEFPIWAYFFFVYRKEFLRSKKISKIILVCMGLISGTTGIVEYFALKYSPAVNYSLLIRSVLLFTILFAFLFLGEKLTKKKILLVLLITIGTYFLIVKDGSISPSKGDLYTIFEAILIAFGNNILGKATTNRLSPNLSAAGNFLVSFLPIMVLAILMHAIVIPTSISLIILLTIFSLGVTFSRFNAYKHLSASGITMVFSFTPVFVSLMAAPLLNEYLSIVQVAGGILVIIAGVLVAIYKI